MSETPRILSDFTFAVQICKKKINIFQFFIPSSPVFYTHIYLVCDKLLIKFVTYSPIPLISDANDVLWGARGICIIIRNENSLNMSII